MSTVRPQDLIIVAGGEALERYGVLSRRTSPGEDVAETNTRSSVGKYLAKNGKLLEAATNVARVAYRGPLFDEAYWLIERTRRNRLLYSEELDNAAWSKTRATISADATTGPDGAATADKLVEDATASATHFIDQAPDTTPTNDTEQTFVVHAKAGERTWVRVAMQLKDGTRLSCYFDLANGVKGTDTSDRSSMEELGGDWYECRISCDCLSGGSTCRGEVFLASADNTPSYSGDGASGLYVTATQFEVDVSFPSSYVKTGAETAARKEDTPWIDFPGAPQAMTGYAKIRDRGFFSHVGRVCQIGDTSASTDPRLVVRGIAASDYFKATYDNGVDAAVDGSSGGSAFPTWAQEFELRWWLNADGSVQIWYSLDGGAESTSGASSAPSDGLKNTWAGQKLWLGCDPATGNVGDQWLRAIKFARGLHTLAEMQAAA